MTPTPHTEGDELVDPPRRHNHLTETMRQALMQLHSDDWDMETIAEVAYICSNVALKAVAEARQEGASKLHRDIVQFIQKQTPPSTTIDIAYVNSFFRAALTQPEEKR